MKKMLIVAYYFPPYGGVGGIRVAKLVKYFRELNWDITVITVEKDYYGENLDYNKLDDIPNDVKVIRTRRMKNLFKFKEEGIYWSHYLYKKMSKILNREKFDYIYFTGGPFFHWYMAPKFKRKYGVEYILDFRDPWSLNPYYNSKFRRLASGYIEPKVIKHAKFVLNVTDSATDLYLGKYKEEKKSKFITIPNGFDPKDFENIELVDLGHENTLKIVYAGKFGSFRNPIPFLKALKRYNEKYEKKIIFYHIGQNEEVLQEFIASNPEINKYIYQLGFLPYKDTISYMKNCDIGLIISGGHPFEPTTKIYDYIALDLPIFCINNINYGYLYETLKNYNTLYCENNCSSIYESLISQDLLINSENINNIEKTSFDREKIFKKLNKLLRENKTF